MGKGELLFLLKGLQWTLVLSAVGFACGTFTGLGVALARTSGFRFLERIAAGYIALFQDTPLLMQLFVVYYGLALYGMKLDAWVAIAIGRASGAVNNWSRNVDGSAPPRSTANI